MLTTVSEPRGILASRSMVSFKKYLFQEEREVSALFDARVIVSWVGVNTYYRSGRLLSFQYEGRGGIPIRVRVGPI